MKKKMLSLLIGRELRRKMIGACVLSFSLPVAMAAEDSTDASSDVETITIQGTELSRYEFLNLQQGL